MVLPGVDSAASARELAAKLLPSLSDEHADVVELAIVVKLSHTKASAELGIPSGGNGPESEGIPQASGGSP